MLWPSKPTGRLYTNRPSLNQQAISTPTGRQQVLWSSKPTGRLYTYRPAASGVALQTNRPSLHLQASSKCCGPLKQEAVSTPTDQHKVSRPSKPTGRIYTNRPAQGVTALCTNRPASRAMTLYAIERKLSISVHQQVGCKEHDPHGHTWPLAHTSISGVPSVCLERDNKEVNL